MLKSKWTFEACSEDAKRFSRRVDWQKGSPTAYSIAYRNDWLDAVCAHMNYKKRQRWSLLKCMEDAKRFSTRAQWQFGSSGYDAALRCGWLARCCGHMGRPYQRMNSKKHNSLCLPNEPTQDAPKQSAFG